MSNFSYRTHNCRLLLWIIAGFVGSLLFYPLPLLAENAQLIDNDTCFACHGDPEGEKFVDPEKYGTSIHGRNLCISCHTDITEAPHAEVLQKVSCRTCHRVETSIYLESDHGKALSQGVTEAATCQSCHGNPHELLDSRNPLSPVFHKNIPATCAQCHEKTEEMGKFHFDIQEPVASYQHSVHGIALREKGDLHAAVCTDCHGSHALSKETNPSSKLYWQNIPQTCGKCHENVHETYMRSVHGKAVLAGKRDAPVCTDCHGEHSIDSVKQATSKVSPLNVPETCGQCHGAERITTKYRMPKDVMETYMESYHGLTMRLGSVAVANCASCHGVHDILPSSDANSTVYPANLERTCGKCHAGVSAQVAKGKIHYSVRGGIEDKVNDFVRRFYIILIMSVIGFMLLHNMLDFAGKLKEHYRQMRALGKPNRMGVSERIQHLILLSSFIILAYTGFALKFPQAWWASPFVGRFDWRGMGHRVAALAFCVLAAYHVWFLLFTKKGRWQLNALWLRKKDFIQCKDTFLFYAGRRKEKPVYEFYSYIEKFEYWALVWGSFIMVITGALMLKENWFLRYFPKWLYDVMTTIHYYEAILACLAILIWHGYFVIFDPEVYPMKWTWVNGRGSKEDSHRQGPPEK